MVNLWDVEGLSLSGTHCFIDFWKNCMAVGRVSYSYPHLMWGRFPLSTNVVSYILYRSSPTNGSAPADNAYGIQFNTSGDTTFDYEDNTVSSFINDEGSSDSYINLYYVKAQLPDQTQSDRTNIVAVFSNINWSNALAMAKEDNHPKLFWDTYHGSGVVTGFCIHKTIITSTGRIVVTKNVPNTTHEYIDTDFSLTVTRKPGDFVEYWIQVQFEDGTFSSETNHVSTRGTSSIQWKTAQKDSADDLHYNHILFENYPNPFNPSTTISYQIPTKSFVTLKVYDVLGNEVAELVNEWKKPGSYYAQFTTSGMYFYSLTAGKFTDTKKFILLK